MRMLDEISMFAVSWRSDSDALAAYRPRIGALISGLGSALLLPFIIMQGIQGRWGLAALFLTIAVVLLLNVWAVKRRQRPFVPFGPVVAALSFAVCISVLVQGQNGILWAYPVLFIGFFILARRWANIIGLVLLVGVSLATWQAIGVALASRVATTLFLNFVMINLVLNVLDHLHEALTRQAILDPLTAAYNRRHFQTRINAASATESKSIDSLLVFDIDHFKRVNDAYGHDIGDHVLKAVAQLAQSVKRPADELYRLGGEEFALLLSNADPDIADHLAETLRSEIESLRPLPCPESAVTVSIGIANRRGGMSADEWFKEADVALYDAKRRGRNRVVRSDRLQSSGNAANGLQIAAFADRQQA